VPSVPQEFVDARRSVARKSPPYVIESPELQVASKNAVPIAFHIEPRRVHVPEEPVLRPRRLHESNLSQGFASTWAIKASVAADSSESASAGSLVLGN
jgi:hypothetical protein